ncbi:hypothetical protein [Bacillus testis]|uniref:hypothetical protein n=1 Tax=Bacillus testis TaxID=1622072 RepID=UPI00067E917A|nr:hypothetical protein [Bacillus testis]
MKKLIQDRIYKRLSYIESERKRLDEEYDLLLDILKYIENDQQVSYEDRRHHGKEKVKLELAAAVVVALFKQFSNQSFTLNEIAQYVNEEEYGVVYDESELLEIMSISMKKNPDIKEIKPKTFRCSHISLV